MNSTTYTNRDGDVECQRERERERDAWPKDHDNLLCDFFAYFASANGMECCARRLPNSNGAVKTSLQSVCVCEEHLKFMSAKNYLLFKFM